MILTIETNSNDKFEVLLNFLRVNGYKVKVDNPTLSEDDWILPGKSISLKEIEDLSHTMDQDSDEGVEANMFFSNLVKEINA